MDHSSRSGLTNSDGMGDMRELLLDKNKMRELCYEITGDRDALDDQVITKLSLLAEDMVDNIVDFSCMYAKHRNSDTLDK